MFSMMKSDIVVTNLRIKEPDWLQVKVAASEVGVSVNEYINQLIKKFMLTSELGVPAKSVKAADKRRAPIWDIGNLMKGIKREPMGLSSEDIEIYGE